MKQIERRLRHLKMFPYGKMSNFADELLSNHINKRQWHKM